MNKIRNFCQEYGVDRRGTDSLKWDGATDRFGQEGLLPLWVADMDFKQPKAAIEALHQRIDHGIFGYTAVSESYLAAYQTWQKERFQVNLTTEWMRFSTGVVNSFFWMVDCFTEPGDSVAILSPVYYPFYDAIEQNKRRVVAIDLKDVEGHYQIDFAAFDRQLSEQHVKLFIHCSPHNPIGRVWSKEETQQLFSICKKHGVLIVSDEIHQDILRPGVTFTSGLHLLSDFRDQLIVLTAPSKTFNMAALLHSHIIIASDHLRQQYDNYAEHANKATISVLGMVAAEACYREGANWLTELIEVIEYNYTLLKEQLAKKAPAINVFEKEGTYLAWLDIGAYLSDVSQTQTIVQEVCHLAVDYGEWFGQGYQGYIRLNLATDPKNIHYAIDQLAKLAE